MRDQEASLEDIGGLMTPDTAQAFHCASWLRGELLTGLPVYCDLFDVAEPLRLARLVKRLYEFREKEARDGAG